MLRDLFLGFLRLRVLALIPMLLVLAFVLIVAAVR
jgi:hypothetical protein